MWRVPNCTCSQLSSAVGVNVGILPALVDWNASANETSYDGTNNWTGVSSITPGWHYSDVDRVNHGARVTTYANSVSAGWMTWDVADLVQAALASGDDELDVLLLVDSDASGGPAWSGVEASTNERPWLNLTGERDRYGTVQRCSAPPIRRLPLIHPRMPSFLMSAPC